MENNTNQKAKNRDINIELLRIVAILMVTTIHCIDNGLIMQNANNLSVYNYVFVNFLRACAGIANGLFLIITGYYQINNKFNLKKIFNLWGKTLFYSILIFIVLNLFGYKTYLLQSILPITTGVYWFITAYIALYFISPLLNIILNKLTKNQFKFLVILLVIMFGILRIVLITETFIGNLFPVIMYYIIGAYLRKFVEIKPKQKYFTKYLLVAIIFACLNITVSTLIKILPQNIVLVVLFNINNKFLDFSNILIIIMAVLLFIKFKTIQIKPTKLSKFITLISPSVLSIYIIQENIHFRSLWRYDGVMNYGNSLLMIPYTFLLIIAVFIICLLIDLIRRGIYSLLNKIPIISKMITKLNQQIDKINIKVNNYIA